MKNLFLAATFGLFLLLPGARGADVPATIPAELKLEMPGRRQTVTLKDLKHRLKPATFTIEDPVYKKTKTYEGFWLTDVIKLAGLGETGGDEIVFHAADGYSPTMPYARLGEHKGMLAFGEKGLKGGWEKIKQGKVWLSPAPFYMVWDKPDESLPWPYQLVGLEVVRFKEKYDRIYPEGEERTSAVFKGFDHFRGMCLRCHSLNLQGGGLGPELNVPQNITEYWDEKVIARFIRDPGKFRAADKMPPFPDFKDEDIQDILAYLRWMKEHKRAPAG